MKLNRSFGVFLLVTAICAIGSAGLFLCFQNLSPPNHQQREFTKDVWVPEGWELQAEEQFHLGVGNNIRDISLDEFQRLNLVSGSLLQHAENSRINIIYLAKNPDKESVVDIYRSETNVYKLADSNWKITRHVLDPYSQKVFIRSEANYDYPLADAAVAGILGVIAFCVVWAKFTQSAPKEPASALAPNRS